MAKASLASWTWQRFMSDLLHRHKAVILGENLGPSMGKRAARPCVSPGDATLVATNAAKWKCIVYMCRHIHVISITLAFPLHVYNIQITAFHYTHQMCPFIVCHLSFPAQKEMLQPLESTAASFILQSGCPRSATSGINTAR